MLLRIDDPNLLPDLIGHLRRGIDVVAAQVGRHEVLVGLLGSRSESSQRLELQSRLSSWQREHPHARVLLAETV